jgi:hypothetical protein
MRGATEKYFLMEIFVKIIDSIIFMSKKRIVTRQQQLCCFIKYMYIFIYEVLLYSISYDASYITHKI